jgi:hypothetical protein
MIAGPIGFGIPYGIIGFSLGILNNIFSYVVAATAK